VISDEELGPEYIIPSVFNRDVAPRVAAEVAAAAEKTGVAAAAEKTGVARRPSAGS
jgi:malate dehydrogenase (oxaloacetate-decarboxylating)